MTTDQQSFHDAMTGKNANVFTQPSPERMKECQERGEMIGMLMVLKYETNPEMRAKIEKFLARIKK